MMRAESPLKNERTKLLHGGASLYDDGDDSGSVSTKKIFQFVMGTMLLLGVASFLNHSTKQERSDLLSLSSDDRSLSSTNSKYRKVQGIGFQIYTGGAPAIFPDGRANPECAGRASYGISSYGVWDGETQSVECYIGHDDSVLDVHKRIEILKAAVEKAYQEVSAAEAKQQHNGENDNDPSETLKVFLAPEFYWRGVNGAYLFAQEAPEEPSICGPVCMLLKACEEIVADKRFEDWLFLFGTVIASEKLPTEDSYDFLFYNFAPIYKGYDPAVAANNNNNNNNNNGALGKRFLLPKRYLSSSDFLSPQRTTNSTLFKQLAEGIPLDHATKKEIKHRSHYNETIFNPHDYERKRYNADIWTKYKGELNELGYTLIEYGWLMIDGLSISIEVCLDHMMRTALNTYLGDMTTGRHTRIPSSTNGKGISNVSIPSYQAQISLVSSGGMQINPDSLALIDQGVIFLQDGLTNETNQMYWETEDQCQQGLQFDGGTEAATRSTFLSSTDVFF